MSKLISQVLVLAALLVSTLTMAQQVDPRSKVPADVLRRPTSDFPLDMHVTLEDSDIRARAAQARQAKGLQVDDAEISEKKEAEFSALRRSVFPGGRRGSIVVLEEGRHVPTVVVRVPDAEALNELLADPRVKSADDLHRKYFPADSGRKTSNGRAAAEGNFGRT
jgi:hypothetical protein